MKAYFYAFCILFSLNVMAEENPADFCEDNYYCTQKMRDITQEFKNGNAQFANEAMSGFSGGCYHLSDLYNSEHEHHGAFLFERKGDDLFSRGSFFFFWGQDPFLGMNASDMKDFFDQRNARLSKTVVSANQVELQYLGEQTNYHYWFRNNKALDKVIMIAKQKSSDSLGLIFCELNRH